MRAADRSSPDPQQWRIEAPARASRAQLLLTFPEPLDHGLLQHSIRVTNAAGVPVGGTVSVDGAERHWRFEPDASWQAGEYHLDIDAALEDLAGNRIGRLFDADMAESHKPADARGEPEKRPARLRFVVE